MNIYYITKDYNYADLEMEDKDLHFIKDSFIGNSIKEKWDSVKMKWDINEKSPIADFPNLGGIIPLFNKKTKTKLDNLLQKEIVELLPVDVENEEYFILNAIKLYDGILNKSKSDIDYFSKDRIMTIDKYVFKKQTNLAPIFKIVELPVKTFVTDEFKEIVEREKLTGIKFVECKQSNSWF